MKSDASQDGKSDCYSTSVPRTGNKLPLRLKSTYMLQADTYYVASNKYTLLATSPSVLCSNNTSSPFWSRKADEGGQCTLRLTGQIDMHSLGQF